MFSQWEHPNIRMFRTWSIFMGCWYRFSKNRANLDSFSNLSNISSDILWTGDRDVSLDSLLSFGCWIIAEVQISEILCGLAFVDRKIERPKKNFRKKNRQKFANPGWDFFLVYPVQMIQPNGFYGTAQRTSNIRHPEPESRVNEKVGGTGEKNWALYSNVTIHVCIVHE